MITIIAYFVSHDESYREGIKNVLEITIPQLEIRTFDEVPDQISSDVSMIIIEPIFDNNNWNIGKIEQLAEHDNIRICVILDNDNESELLEILSYKIHGVCFKSEQTSQLINGIKSVINVGHYIPENVGKLLLDVYRKQGGVSN